MNEFAIAVVASIIGVATAKVLDLLIELTKHLIESWKEKHNKQ